MIASTSYVPLGDVLNQSNRAVPSSDLSEINLAGVYSFGRGLFKRGPLRPVETSYRFYNRLVLDDFVISQPKAWEGALARVTRDFDGWFLSPVFPTFTAKPDRLLPAYLEWFCKRKSVWQDLQILSKGMGARRETVSPDQFLSLKIPLPPLDEQHRIVARLDELAEKAGEVQRLRASAVAGLNAVVIAAIKGVEERYSGYSTTLGSVLRSCKNGLSRRPSGEETGPIVLRLADVSSGQIDLSTPRRGSLSDMERVAYALAPGDILAVRVNGSRSIVGRFIPVQESNDELCFNDHLIRIRIDTSRIEPEFLAAIGRGPHIRQHIEDSAITTAGQFTVNQSMLANAPIPLPPLAEQRRVLGELDALQNQLASVKVLQSGTAAEIDAILPAILDKAFKGEL